jgi:hypothetical protein
MMPPTELLGDILFNVSPFWCWGIYYFMSRLFGVGGHIISSPCQRQCELLASVVCRTLTFHVVLEETIFLEINQSETRIVCGGHVC